MIKERGLWVNGKGIKPADEKVEVGWILVMDHRGMPIIRTDVFRVMNVGDTLTIEYKIERAEGA